MTQTIIVIAIVAAAVAWAIWTIVKRARGGASGCASCGTAASCPYAQTGVCPSEMADDTSGSEDATDGL